MKLICPECSTSYAPAPSALGETGRKVKCHKCAHVWFATPQEAFDVAQRAAPPSADGMADDFDSEVPAALEDGDAATAQGGGERDISSAAAEADAAWDAVLEDAGFTKKADYSEDDLQLADPSGDDEGFDLDALAGNAADIETLAARGMGKARADPRASRRRLRLPRITMVSLSAPMALVVAMVLALALAGVGLFQFRDPVVAALPGTAKFYAAIGYPVNLRGLELVNVTFSKTIENGLPVLAVSGEIVNITGAPIRVPDLRFSLRNGQAQEIYRWTGRAETGDLGPLERTGFLTRLASPPSAAAEVQVRFTGKARMEAQMNDELRS